MHTSRQKGGSSFVDCRVKNSEQRGKWLQQNQNTA